jgi:hypothetical protein
MSNKLLFSLLLGVLMIASLNVFTGTYFEDYEVLIGGVFLHEFSAPMDYSWNANIWFLFTPIIAFFSDFFQELHFYSLLTNAINAILPISLIYFILSWSKFKNLGRISKGILLIVVLLLSVKNIMLVSNRRMVLNLLFSSITFLILYFDNNQKRKEHLVISCLLLVASVFLRFELVMLCLVVFAPLYLSYKNRGFWKFYLAFFIFATAIFSMFKILQNTVYKEYAYREKAEHEFIDRQTIYFDEDMSEIEIYKLYAMMMYVQDQDVYDSEDYGELLASVDYVSYIGKPWLLAFWQEKVVNFYNAFDYRLILLFVLCSIWVIFKQKRYRLLPFLSLILITPLLFSFLLIFPVNLYEGMMVLVIIGLTFLIFRDDLLVSVKLVFAFIVILALGSWGKDFLRVQKEYEDLFWTYRNDMLDFKSEEKEVVFANFTNDFVNYPRRTFSLKPKNKVDHYYLDLFFYSSYNFYIDHHREFFHDGIKKLTSRIRDCTKPNVVFYANEQQKEFLTNYLSYFHNMQISFKILPEASHYEWENSEMDISLPYQLIIL